MPSKQKSEKVPEDEIIKISDKLMKNGLNISEISRVISHDLNIPKRDVYQLLIKKGNNLKMIYIKTCYLWLIK